VTQVRAWLRRLDPGSWLVIVAITAILAAIVLMPPLPATEAGVPPGSTIPYGQPDTMLDGLEDRVYTVEQVQVDQHEWIVELEERIEELERERR
jgi:hypothetical protein